MDTIRRTKLTVMIILVVMSSTVTFSQSNKGTVAAKPKPVKRALIVAVSDYTTKLGWLPLSSYNDQMLLAGALEQIGFSRQDIDTLIDAAATRDGILRALKKLAEKSMPGDMVMVHISSHGQQISDNVGPDELDGYDETIVAYGAPAGESFYRNANPRSRGTELTPYDGRLHLRDDDLGKAIDAIRAKVGKDGHVLVSLDACHSGTGTRGAAIARGTEAPYDLVGVPSKALVGVEQEYGLEITPGTGLGKFVLISGAAAKEVNYETKDDNTPAKGVGSLSYSLAKALPSMPANSTYRNLFARIASEMAGKAPNQTPQLEGDVDAKLFNDGYVPQPPYFAVDRIITARQLKIKAGRLANISPTAKVSIRSNLDRKELAIGEVVEAGSLDAIVDLDRDLTEKFAVNLQVHVLDYVISTSQVIVSLDSVRDVVLRKKLTDTLTAKALVQVGTNGAELTISDRGSRNGRYMVKVNTTAYDSPLMPKPVTGAASGPVVADIFNVVENYVQGKTFRGMDMEDDAYRVEVRMIPVRQNKKYGQKECLSDTISPILDKGGMLLVPQGTPFIVSVRNKGTKRAYFNLIDLEVNGKVSPIYPRLSETGQIEPPPPDELVLEPGKTLTYCDVLTYPPPYGPEMLKVFSSGVPFDLSSTINSKGALVGTRGSGPTPLEKLVGKALEPPSTRGPTITSSKEEMGVNSFEYVFKIVPRKN